INLWHRRTCHQGIDSVISMIKNNLVEGMEVDPTDLLPDTPLPICSPCILGKHERTTFPLSNTRATKPLERIHADL
ncbi:hypothetical protein SISSUDRAFT_955430, partial [Sistotremastrum suecicum HHB10207 ss-3]